MKLTKVERWMLSNQYRILEALYPNEKESLSEARRALEEGYELEYQNMSQYICEDKDCMTRVECEEVIDILSMFRSLHDAKDKGEVEEYQITFQGFDGNDRTEVKYLAYARYFCESDGGRFQELKGGDYNSHSLMLGTYRRMLKAWKESNKQYQLTKQDVERIAESRAYSAEN